MTTSVLLRPASKPDYNCTCSTGRSPPHQAEPLAIVLMCSASYPPRARLCSLTLFFFYRPNCSLFRQGALFLPGEMLSLASGVLTTGTLRSPSSGSLWPSSDTVSCAGACASDFMTEKFCVGCPTDGGELLYQLPYPSHISHRHIARLSYIPQPPIHGSIIHEHSRQHSR